MAFELNRFGIGIKTIEPGGIRTDFFTRSLDTGRHPAYDALVNKFIGMITDPKQMETYSSPEQIAESVRSRYRRKEPTPVHCWCRRKSDVRNALAAWG